MGWIQGSIVGRREIAREGLRKILAQEGFRFPVSVSGVEQLEGRAEVGEGRLIVFDACGAPPDLAELELLCARYPGQRVVVISEECDAGVVGRSLAVGVHGYLSSGMASAPFANALRMIILGESMVPSEVVGALMDRSSPVFPGPLRALDGESDLTDREHDILAMLVSGESNKVISRQLSITEATVKVHIKAILRKLKLANRTQAAIWALAAGISRRPD